MLHPEAILFLLVPSFVDLWLLWAASAVIELKMAAESTPPPIEEAFVRVVVDGGLVLTAM